MPLRLLRAPDVHAACGIGDAIAAVSAGFVALSAGQAAAPLRTAVDLPEGAVVLTMPATAHGLPYFAVKVVSVTPANRGRGRPLIGAVVLLGDAATGEALALLEGGALTALRTGAAGGLAAELLARPDAHVAALFGAGAQGREQLRALVSVRGIRDVRVVARDAGHAETLVRWAAGRAELGSIRMRSATADDAVAGADVVVTATTSAVPVFDGRRLSPGAHVTAVGAFTPDTRELDVETMRGATVFVDHLTSALAEAGELRGLDPADLREIGDVAAGRVAGRTRPEERTVFKTVGTAIQDLFVAATIYDRARVMGIGEELRFP